MNSLRNLPSEPTIKDVTRALHTARRAAARQFREPRHAGVHETFGKTISGVNPWGMPSDGISWSHRETKRWERQQYHRATRREAKQVVTDAITEMHLDYYLDYQEYLRTWDPLDAYYYDAFCSEVHLPHLHRSATAA